MQTFLPWEDFSASARTLDRQRLGRQRVEALQILTTLMGESQGWRNHPAVKMWWGSEMWLYIYAGIMCDEWITRGYKDAVLQKLRALWLRNPDPDSWGRIRPAWLGDGDFHLAHRSNLVRKNHAFYGLCWPHLVGSNLPYIWPKGARS